MPDFLLEIGTEEIPARMLHEGAAELQAGMVTLLSSTGLMVSHGLPEGGEATVIEAYSTPRRVTVIARNLKARELDSELEVTGPAVKVAFKSGRPTAAAEAFAKKIGVTVDKLEAKSTPKGDYLTGKIRKTGGEAAEVLAEIVPIVINKIYWPKNMYWRAGKPERFVRPVRWIVALLDGEVVPLEFGGVRAGRSSRGHRILSRDGVTIGKPQDYAETLARAFVMVSPAAREEHIRKSLDQATRSIPGARWREDKELLSTVVNLTEFPSVILGSFDREFLSLPEEVLVTVMRDHQKYFAVEDAKGRLAPHFLAVLNTDGDPDGMIRHGNERVLRARFSDARFFWETDQKVPLRERVAMLKPVTFQKDLGSYYDKTVRVQKLASILSQQLKDAGVNLRPGVVHKAALLAKTDLTTELVKEFTELQGIVGGLYARVQQLDPNLPENTRLAVADAIYDQYKPASMEDAAPRTVEGAVLSVADKADSIAGMFALGLQPTGSKDPFALRRQANGIVKVIAEHKLPLSIPAVMRSAREGYAGSEAAGKFRSPADAEKAMGDFFRERLEFYLREVGGFAYDVVNAVLTAGADDVVDAVARAEAVTKVRDLPDFQSIAIACKRIRNILRQADEKGIQRADRFEYEHEKADEAKTLAAKFEQMIPRVDERRARKDYADALLMLSALRPAVDTFFDKIMVMVDDARIRANRLALLQKVLSEFSTIADFSEIVTEGKNS